MFKGGEAGQWRAIRAVCAQVVTECAWSQTGGIITAPCCWSDSGVGFGLVLVGKFCLFVCFQMEKASY